MKKARQSLYFIATFLSFYLLAIHISFGDAKGPSTLFVLYDAGETKGLQPVFKELDKKSIDYAILAFSTALSLVESQQPAKSFDKNCGVVLSAERIHWSRTRKLSEKQIAKLKGCVRPKVIVTGVVSEVQAQVARSYKKEAFVAGFYDAFSPPEEDTLVVRAGDSWDEIWIPTNKLSSSLLKGHRLRVVGQPSLEHWAQTTANVDPRKIYAKLELAATRPMVLYAGGYGRDYAEAFRLFVRATRAFPSLTFLLSLHPKVDGKLEKQILREEGAENIQVVPKTIDTKSVSVIAEVIVCHRSTVGVQALFMNKPVIYLDLPTGNYTNVAIQENWAVQVRSLNEFQKVLERLVKKKSGDKPLDIYSLAEIPRRATLLISRVIEDRLSQR